MMRQDKDRRMKRRVAAPPPLPVWIPPPCAHRAEHVPAHDPGTDVFKTACRVIVVSAYSSAFAPCHVVKRTRGEEPFEHRAASNPQRVGEILIYPGAVAIQGNTETPNLQFAA